MNMFYRIFTILAFAVAYVTAERHIVSFENRCGRGTPTLVSQEGEILSTGAPHVSNAPLIGAISYLQTGEIPCGLNGEYCTLVETTLRNPLCPGCGSSTDISLISPHAFSITTGFRYQNGCDGAGANCNNPNCTSAFRAPSDTHVQVACQVSDVNLVVTFCG